MSGKSTTKTDVISIYQQAIDGVTQYLSNRTMPLNGKALTSKAVIALLQAQIDALRASTAAHTAWIQAVAKERASEQSSSAPLLAALRHYVAAVFGTTSDEYLAFGFQPPKPRGVKSPQAKVISAVKSRATRKARNTLGSKQRLGVTGTVPSEITLSVGNAPASALGVVPAPGGVTAAPATSAAPAQPPAAVTVTTSANGVAPTH
jgi:hypothetical protein